MKGQAAVQTCCIIEKINILLNKIFAYNNLAIHQSQGNCPQLFIRQNDIIDKLYTLKGLGINDEIFVTSLFLVDKLASMNKFYLNRRNIYNLFMTAIILSIKMYNDNQIALHIYRIIFETTIDEINQMEKKFLKLIQYSLFVRTEEYYNYRSRLLKMKE